MPMIRHDDCLSMAELASRFLAVALNACLSPINVGARSKSKKRSVLVKPRATFQRYIETRRFGKLLKILKNDRCHFSSWLPNSATSAQGQSALHLILQYNPTVDAVDALLVRMKRLQPEANPEQFQDNLGMTPLHLAIARSCDARIVELLLLKNGIPDGEVNAAGIMDSHQRYPLHYICMNPTRIQKKISGKDISANFEDTLRIIRCLIVSFPKAIDSPDKNGWTPKLMAETLGADETLIHILQNPQTNKYVLSDTKSLETKVHSLQVTQTSTDMSEVLGLPFDVIHCHRIYSNDGDDYDVADDVSSIGWNDDRKTIQRNDSNPMKEIDLRCDMLTITESEIYVDNGQLSPKFRFL
jgi:Ankyrin repeats (3 copies)